MPFININKLVTSIGETLNYLILYILMNAPWHMRIRFM